MAKEKKEKKVKQEKQAKSSKPISTYFNQKTFLGVTLVGVLVLVIIYMFVYLDFTEKTEALEQSNKAIAETIQELEEYNTNMEAYKLEIKEIEAEIYDILDAYPADAREEDAIMLAVELQERNVIDFDAINMEETEGVYTVEPYLVTAAALEGFDQSLVFRQKHAVYVNETTYKELKSVIKQIYASSNRIGIDNIVYSKNDEYGILEGNIDIYFYSLAGTDKEYKAPDIAKYSPGTSDPFRSEEIARRMAAEMLEGEEAEDGAEENAN